MRLELTLQCDECKEQNYRTSRNRDGVEKINIKKYCSRCRTRTLHKEKRK